MKHLLLEIGKSYRSKDGSVAKIVGRRNSMNYPFYDEDGFTYTATGRSWVDEISENDLIEEVQS